MMKILQKKCKRLRNPKIGRKKKRKLNDLMLAWLALKDRHHKNFSREVRESKGCRKAGRAKQNNQTPEGPFTWHFSHTTHSEGDLPISPGKNQVSIIASMAVGRKLQ